MYILQLLFVSQLFFGSAAFRWHLTDVFSVDKVLTFSEHYMFRSHDGPALLEQGDSYISVIADYSVFLPKNESKRVAVAIFASEQALPELSLCGVDVAHKYKKEMTAVYQNEFVPTFVRAMSHVDSATNETIYSYNYFAKIHIRYAVIVEKWHTVAFQICDESADTRAAVDGTVSFHNPYGFIPAELYGFLPFQAARMVAYVLFGVYFLYRYFRYRESVLPVHNAVLVVYLVALVEAVMWYSAYETINLTGEPYCCPFPPTVVASLILQIFRQTLVRGLLIVVVLGYGIVRPRLLPTEWIAAGVITGAYFCAAAVAKIAEIVLENDVRNSSTLKRDLNYQIPELFMDVIFLTWIYLALGSTLRILSDYQQTYKYMMYKRLAYTIGAFVSMFTLVSVVIMLANEEYFTWPWQLLWLQQVSWETLNFAVLCAACCICLPSENSNLLSYAAQLPTEDPDEDEEMGEEDEDDEEDEENDFDQKRSREIELVAVKSQASGQTWRTNNGHESLPPADDE